MGASVALRLGTVVSAFHVILHLAESNLEPVFIAFVRRRHGGCACITNAVDGGREVEEHSAGDVTIEMKRRIVTFSKLRVAGISFHYVQIASPRSKCSYISRRLRSSLAIDLLGNSAALANILHGSGSATRSIVCLCFIILLLGCELPARYRSFVAK